MREEEVAPAWKCLLANKIIEAIKTSNSDSFLELRARARKAMQVSACKD
jgi:hypothetical protein